MNYLKLVALLCVVLFTLPLLRLSLSILVTYVLIGVVSYWFFNIVTQSVPTIEAMANKHEDYLSTATKNLSLSSKNDINILLMGATGVGKSTFINAIANYCQHGDWDTAQEKDLVTIIPYTFTIRDKNNIEKTINVGEPKDKNEYLYVGASATQDVKTYVFRWHEYNIRLIDTPGIGDTRGITQDMINCDNILRHISKFNEIHAIIYICQSNSSRLTVYFDYCMTQIMSRLHKSASENLIFAFTNTRGTDYNEGDTLQSLRELIRKIGEEPPYVKIPLDKNIFCFDNESMRFLAAVKQNVEFDNAVKRRNMESWKKSTNSWWKLLAYIIGDRATPPLPPHKVQNTVSINEVRRFFTQLSQPLAEISELINDNIYALKQHQHTLEMIKETLGDLQSNLYIPFINLKHIKLSQPVTVCTALKCCQIYKIGDITKYHYTTRCHDPCYLQNVPQEVFGSPELLHCAAINRASKACYKCGCDFSTHMHVYYMTEPEDDKIIDKQVRNNILTKQQKSDAAERYIKEMEQRKTEMEWENEQIVAVAAHCAYFIQKKAIAAFHDSYKQYIEYLIEREKQVLNPNTRNIKNFQSLLKQYEDVMDVLKKSSETDTYKNLSHQTDDTLSQEIVLNKINNLFRLKHFGKKIKELYESQLKVRQTENENAEYVHAHKINRKPQQNLRKQKNVGNSKPNSKQFQNNSTQRNQNRSSQQSENRPRQWQNRQIPRNQNRDPPPSYSDVRNDRRSNEPEIAFKIRLPSQNQQNQNYPPNWTQGFPPTGPSYAPPPPQGPYAPPPQGPYAPPPQGPYAPPPQGPYAPPPHYPSYGPPDGAQYPYQYPGYNSYNGIPPQSPWPQYQYTPQSQQYQPQTDHNPPRNGNNEPRRRRGQNFKRQNHHKGNSKNKYQTDSQSDSE